MLALRRAANPIRSHSAITVVARACCTKSGRLSTNTEQGEQCHVNHYWRSDGCYTPNSFSYGHFNSAFAFLWSRNLSSQTSTTSSDEEDGFSDLDIPPEAENVKDEELMPEGELSEEGSEEAVDNSIDFLDAEVDSKSEKNRLRKRSSVSSVLTIIQEAPRHAMAEALDKWVEEGNKLGRDEAFVALLNLRKWKLYPKALQFMEYLEATKHIDFVERDYSSCVDLVAKVYGLHRAEKYIEKIPPVHRGEMIYRTLLANCVATSNVMKSEEIFNKIRDLGFPLTTFACNQLLLLYKRVDRKKIADVLLMMEKENVKPSLFTYKLLVDVKGTAKDISGMEQIVETMRAEGMEPDILIQAMVAKYYIYAGLKDKADAILKKIEGDGVKENRDACKVILPLYAALGKAEEVERVWKMCETKPRLDECLAVIEAWDKLDKIENAEKVFENMFKTYDKLSAKYYNALMKVYANHKLLHKGKELVKRMSDNGCRIGPLTLDALVKCYVEAQEVEKADSILKKASQRNQMKPLYSTYLTLLDNYAKKGDIHGAEKIFYRARQVGYLGRMKQYQLLLQAYINAHSPAYGFRERMKADNVFPNKAVAAQLASVDAFRKTPISELLD
ncbi:pentatricopeptide repeat-containing protein At1g80270, mitochondrial-like [Typha angustifolia]|uniref:pentatricopeptide repeat-containing protein At1g80270, mitochondrial-like n=1 Tax=Typha angustifolia TaxID=59011 RepID=UPI003C2FAF4C